MGLAQERQEPRGHARAKRSLLPPRPRPMPRPRMRPLHHGANLFMPNSALSALFTPHVPHPNYRLSGKCYKLCCACVLCLGVSWSCYCVCCLCIFIVIVQLLFLLFLRDFLFFFPPNFNISLSITAAGNPILWLALPCNAELIVFSKFLLS